MHEGNSASIGKDLHQILKPYLFSCIIGIETNTEIYPIYDYFKEKSVDIRVANPHKLRTLVGKDDPIDAARLSDMLRLNTFPTSYIPEDDVRELRNLVQFRHSILEQSIRLQSQIQAAIRKNGLVMPTGDSFTKKWCFVLQNHILFQKGGLQLKHIYDMYLENRTRLEKVTAEMINFASTKFSQEFEAIIANKGIGPVLTTYFISEICPITRFASNKKLRRYAGVIPVSERSGGKTYATFLPKTSSRSLLRWALIAAAHCMIRCNENMKLYFRKKKKEKKVHGKAIMSVARSISDIIFITLNKCNMQVE